MQFVCQVIQLQAALYPGAEYPETENLKTEILLMDSDLDEYQKTDGDTSKGIASERELEARMIAMRIRELLRSQKVVDKETGELRNVRYSDIVILTRSIKGFADVFTEVLNREGIPAYAGTSEGYFQTQEVGVLLDYLRVLDNRRQDIPLAAVLRSAFAEMSDEEMAEIRCMYPDKPFFESVAEYRVHGREQKIREKLEKCLGQMDELRLIVPYTPMHELLWKILDRTGYGDYEEAHDGTRLYNSCFLSFRTATLIGRDLYIYSDPNRLIEKDYVSATINLDTKEIRALPFVYPDYPGSSVKLKRYGLEGSYSRSFDGQRFVYSFIYDESVYVANIAHDSIRKVSVKSEYIDQVQLPDELTAQAIDFCQNAMYGDLIYDPYREVFYRIAYPSTTIEKGVKAMELIEYGRKTFSIIILDKELNKLGETLFPNYTYNSRQLLVLPDGLYICNSHFMNPDFNDDILSFIRFDLVSRYDRR